MTLLLLTTSTSVYAAGDGADALGVPADGSTVTTVTDANGYLALDGNPYNIILDTTGGDIILGTSHRGIGGFDAITTFEQTGSGALAYTVTASGSGAALANVVKFLGDIEHVSAADTMTITTTNTDLLFYGDITSAGGVNAIIVGSGTDVNALTFDYNLAQNNAISATINSANAGDTTTINILNTEGTASNVTTFAKTIGNSGGGIDLIAVGAGANATFTLAVVASSITSASTGVVTFAALFTGNATMNAAGTLNCNLGCTGNITLNNADAIVNLPGDKVLTGSLIPGADGYGTFNVGAHTGDVTAVTVKIGATGVKAIKALNVIVDDDETTFANTVDAKTITITQLTGGVNGTVIFGGDVIAASGIAVAGAGTTPIINVASGIDVTADLTVIRTNETIVNMVAGTSVWTGNLGTDALKLKLFNVVSGTTTVNGNIFATNVTVQNGHKLIMGADDDITVTTAVDLAGTTGFVELGTGADINGAVTNAAADKGTLTSTGVNTVTGPIGVIGANELKLVAVTATGKLSINSNIAATNMAIADGGELKYRAADDTISTEGIVTVTGAGVIDVGTNTVLVTAGVVNCGTDCIFKPTIGTTNGQLNSTAAGVVFAADTVVTPVIVGTVTSGTAIVIAQNDDATPGVAPTTANIVDNYARYNFALSMDTTNFNLELTPTAVTPTGVGSAGAAVNKVADAAFATDTVMAGALNGLTGATLDTALITLAPSVDGGAIAGAVSAGSASGSTISTQIASLRNGIAAGSGLNAGDGSENQERFWTQGFGTYAEQELRESIQGFSATTGGVAFGVDKRVQDDVVFGLAYSYSYTTVDGSNSNNETKVQGHQATLYGSHDLDRNIFQTDGVFVDGQLSYGYNDYEGERHIKVGAVSRRADSDYDGAQISTKFDLGKTFNLPGEFRFTPTAGISYSHVSIEEYTETNAGASSLKLKEQDYDILNLNLKTKLSRTFQVAGLDLTPEMHIGYSYEVIHDQIQTTANLTGGGDSFISTGFKPANHTYLGGVGVTWGTGTMPVDVTVTYDATIKDDFVGHSGLIKGLWRF